jgi:hypothetical protein
MDLLSPYIEQLPSGLQTKVWELTETLPLTTSISSTIAQNYETITSVINEAKADQSSAFMALQTVTASVSSISLINDIIQAQATLNYYELLQSIATETNTASQASLMTQAAQASQIMLKMFNEEAYYSGNYPSLGGNIALLVVYSLFFALQIISGVFYHQWWFLTCWSCGLILEILGYAGRIWSSQNIMNFNAFVLQLVCLTLGPCFMMAGIYYVIAQLTLIYGTKFSLLRPMQYSLIFIICDIISIALQAAGGGVAAGALSDYESTDDGSHIMVAGLAFQVFTILVFQLFWYYFFWKVYKSYKKNGDSEFNPQFTHIRERGYLVYFMVAVSVAVVLIFVRSIYRLAELSKGWSSNLAVDEIYFMILEGLMVSLATCILSFMSPGLAYGRGSHLYIDKSLKTTFSKRRLDKIDENEFEKGIDTDSTTDNLDAETEVREDDAAYFNNSNKMVV